MDFQRLIRLFFLSSMIFFAMLKGAEQELLKADDVTKVMQQILKQHVDHKEVSGEVLKHAFRLYIDQFDPLRMYLLNEEVRPYLEISDARMSTIVEQYKKNDFTAFSSLNALIQKSIMRARDLRNQIEKDKTTLFTPRKADVNNDKADWLDPDLKLTFAKNTQDLRARIEKNFMSFVDGEKRRFGVNQVMQNQDQTLNILDRYLSSQENAYLYLTDKGQSLPPLQQENLFVLHVLKALAGSLDAHTTFYDNTEAYDMKVRLEKAFQGIGVILQQGADGMVSISKLVEGGPAEKSGLVLTDDRIIAIDGKPINGVPLETVMEMIRGKSGSSVALQIKRKVAEGDKKIDKTIEVNLKREPITLNDERVDTNYEQFGDGIIGKITLHSFYQGENGVSSENDVRKAIQNLAKKGNLKGLILDLRENSGGFLTQAVKVAGLFITNGVVVISKYSDGREHYYRDMDGREIYGGPLVVLVSKATASAAEIVAQALQDYGVALVVGDEHTYGKGTIQSQTVTDSTASSFFKVTVGKYYTVSGNTPQIRGVRSDILVPGPFSEEHIGEQYLEYALPADKIKPEYKDDLADVDPGLKPWYLRFYMPTLQRKEEDWSKLIPSLKANSEYRIAHNKNYQAFLRQLKGLKPEPADLADEELKPTDNGRKNYNADDLQMVEAVNVVKDMIMFNHHIQPNALARQLPSKPLEGALK